MSIISEQNPFIGKLRVKSKILVETGLHIGGGGERLDIGGLDKSVIRDPLTQYPYLPGSSVKGKLRAILERWLNKPLNRSAQTGGVAIIRHECDDIENWYVETANKQTKVYEGASNCELCRIFGSTGGTNLFVQKNGSLERNKGQNGRNHPARLIVRDCHLSNSVKLAKVKTGLYMTEWKAENGLDRITAAANPRQVERVPKGAEFNFELVYSVEKETQVADDLQHLEIAIAILEDDALGGHGSRGYGKVKFQSFEIFYRGRAEYSNGTTERLIQTANDTSELLGKFDELKAESTQLIARDAA